jgi:hypothetical protein
MCKLCDETPAKKRKIGKMFGYPECCIDEFISDTEEFKKTKIDNRTPEQKSIALYTGGFVPCKNHAIEIEYGGIEVESIIVGRDEKKIKKFMNSH